MSREKWTEVDRYFIDLLVHSDPALDAALESNSVAGLPAMDVTLNQGKLLHLVAGLMGAKRILEIGTLGGYSTIWLVRALPKGGRLVSLEVNPKHAEIALANLARASLFDLIFIDADKPNNPKYLEWALKLSRPGTLIFGDTVVRAAKVMDIESSDANVEGTRQFLELMAAQPRPSATAIQTVGSKGCDGFAMAQILEPSGCGAAVPGHTYATPGRGVLTGEGTSKPCVRASAQ